MLEGHRAPEFLVLSSDWIWAHHKKAKSGWDKVHTKGEALDDFKNEKGFELIAADLDIPYPG